MSLTEKLFLMVTQITLDLSSLAISNCFYTELIENCKHLCHMCP